MPAKKVLLVDDAGTVRKFIHWSLRSSDIETLQAGDGLEALEILRRGPVDLAIVDLNMPGMDGIELTRSIRAMPERRDLPILMLTTEKREEERRIALDAGVNAYLVKPSTPAIIRYKVLSMLGLPDAGPTPVPEASP